MFTVSNPDLLAAEDGSVGYTGALLGFYGSPTSSGGGLFSSFGVENGSLLAGEDAIAIPTYPDDEIEITLPSTVSAITSIEVGGELYNPSAESTPSSGQFTYNPRTRSLTIKLKTTQRPEPDISIRYRYLAVEYPVDVRPTDELRETVPDFLSQWNISGSVSLSRSFEGQPTGSLEFVALASQEEAIRTTLRNLTQIDLWGHGYAIASLDISRRSLRTHSPSLIDVSIQLQGKHQDRLDESIRKKVKNPDRKCTYSAPVSEFAARANLNYKGPDPTVVVPRDTSNDEVTTLRQELEARSRSSGGFVFYSNPDAVEIRQWGKTKLHILSDAEVSEVRLSYPGQEALFGDLQLTNQYRNRVLTLDQTEEAANNTGLTGYQISFEGERVIGSAPVFDLRDGSAAFDAGGPTEYQKTIVRYNGEIIFEDEVVYGFAYAATDVYELEDGKDIYFGNNTFSRQAAWQMIRQVKKRRIFNELGYLVKEQTTGWQLSRFKSDSNLESLNVRRKYEASLNPIYLAELALYTVFHRLPINQETQYAIAPFTEYYPDIKKPLDDDDWIEPFFCLQVANNERSFEVTDDPRSTEVRPRPPLTTGKSFRERLDTAIVYPQQSTPEDEWDQTKERYRQIKRTGNSEGPGLKFGLTIEASDEQSGRPQVHTRLEQQLEDPDCPPPVSVPKSGVTKKYLLNTPGSDPDNFDEGSISFTNATTLEDAVAAARLDISIQNTRGAEQVGLVVDPRRRFDEGDRVLWNGHIYVVFEISEARAIRAGQRITSSGWEVVMGRLLDIPVEVTTVESN